MDARERRDSLRVHRRPRPARRARRRRGSGEGEAVRRRGRGARRLQGAPRARRARGAGLWRVPHPDRGSALLQHDSARTSGHRDDARACHGLARRRDLGRRLDVQGQRHRAVLPLRAARQREPAHLQAVARHGVRRGARRPQGDERVAAGARSPLTRRRRGREGVLDGRQHARRDARGERSRAPRNVDEDRRPRSWASRIGTRTSLSSRRR